MMKALGFHHPHGSRGKAHEWEANSWGKKGGQKGDLGKTIAKSVPSDMRELCAWSSLGWLPKKKGGGNN